MRSRAVSPIQPPRVRIPAPVVIQAGLIAHMPDGWHPLSGRQRAAVLPAPLGLSDPPVVARDSRSHTYDYLADFQTIARQTTASSRAAGWFPKQSSDRAEETRSIAAPDDAAVCVQLLHGGKSGV